MNILENIIIKKQQMELLETGFRQIVNIYIEKYNIIDNSDDGFNNMINTLKIPINDQDIDMFKCIYHTETQQMLTYIAKQMVLFKNLVNKYIDQYNIIDNSDDGFNNMIVELNIPIDNKLYFNKFKDIYHTETQKRKKDINKLIISGLFLFSCFIIF